MFENTIKKSTHLEENETIRMKEILETYGYVEKKDFSIEKYSHKLNDGTIDTKWIFTTFGKKQVDRNGEKVNIHELFFHETNHHQVIVTIEVFENEDYDRIPSVRKNHVLFGGLNSLEQQIEELLVSNKTQISHISPMYGFLCKKN